MREAAKRKLDTRISELERRLERLRALRAALEDDQIVSDLAEVFASNGREGGNIEIVRQFFRERDNAKATLVEMVEATSVSKHSLRQLVYKTHADQFERESHRGGGRQSYFWLKEPEEGTE
jgi:hypothetical protein